MSTPEEKPAGNFIRNRIKDDLATGKWDGRVVTRFPPEPNGYLHIGHAKSFCLNFGLAADFGGRCHLRFDDTNPAKEEVEYVDSIMDNVRWMGFDWGDHLHYASDYFDQLHEFALRLVKAGKAYVDDQSPEAIRAARGTLTEPGVESPYRERTTQENLDIFTAMAAGEFEDGSKVLRAKIDMAHPNLHMRDPIMYRIRKVAHHRTGDKWCIYPMYDFTHCLSDSIERITHSICTLEFEDNRLLYDWFLDELDVYHPQQIEFARLNLEFMVMSKRTMVEMVDEGLVDGWDDPRMPTLVGMRRRGFTPGSIRNFSEMIGVGRKNSWVGMDKLEWAIRDDLNTKARRVLGVLDPLKVVITNYPEGQSEEFDAAYYPDDPPKMGYRKLPFSRELYIEKSDFMEEPFKKFWRLAPGREVRLRWAYFITYQDVIKDENGEVIEVHCTYDPATKGGDAPDGRKVKGTIHWVSAEHALTAEVRLYDRLFNDPRPGGHKDADYRSFLNPDSLKVLSQAKLEASLAEAQPGEHYQFERTGYFFVDPEDSAPGAPVFNRTVTLRDSWARLMKQRAKQKK